MQRIQLVAAQGLPYSNDNRWQAYDIAVPRARRMCHGAQRRIVCSNPCILREIRASDPRHHPAILSPALLSRHVGPRSLLRRSRVMAALEAVHQNIPARIVALGIPVGHVREQLRSERGSAQTESHVAVPVDVPL